MMIWLAAKSSRSNAIITVCRDVCSAMNRHAHYSRGSAQRKGTIDPEKKGDMTLLIHVVPQYSRVSNETKYQELRGRATHDCESFTQGYWNATEPAIATAMLHVKQRRASHRTSSYRR